MSVLAFDTYQAVTALKQAGFEEAQAEAVVTTMGAALGGQVATKADLTEVRTALEADLEQLCLTTKADLTEVRTALEADLAAVKGDIEQLRSETKAELAAGRAEMAEQFAALYKQLWLMAGGGVGLTVTLLKLLP